MMYIEIHNYRLFVWPLGGFLYVLIIVLFISLEFIEWRKERNQDYEIAR